MFHFISLAFIRVSKDLQSLSAQALIQISKNRKYHIWPELCITVAQCVLFCHPPLQHNTALQCLQWLLFEAPAACLGPSPDSPGASLPRLHLMVVTTARDITGGGGLWPASAGGGGISQVTRPEEYKHQVIRYGLSVQRATPACQHHQVSSWWTWSGSRILSWTPPTSAPATWRGWGRCCLTTCREPRGTCHSWRLS